jgi:hypothetical protein
VDERTIRARRVVVTARTDDTHDAVRVMRVSEEAVRRALESVANLVGDGLLVVRRIELTLGIDLDRAFPATKDIERVLKRALERRLEELCREAQTGRIAEDAAWFDSRAAAAAAYLAADARGAAGTWPYRSLPHAGLSWSEVLKQCAAEGERFLADVLGRTARELTPREFAGRIPWDVAIHVLSLYGGIDRPSLELQDLPADVRRALSDAEALLRETSESPNARLAWLAQLFSVWPPARDYRIDVPSTAGPATPSTAGGLVLWAQLLRSIGFFAALEVAYPIARVRRAVLWALGRALEAPQMSGHDPLLLVWSGEDPGSRMSATQTLADADPEPLHRLALHVALAQKWDVLSLRSVPAAGAIHALSPENIVVDTVEGVDNAHQAVSRLVERFMARTKLSPVAVSVEVEGTLSDIDSLRDVDVPAVPDAWRPAVRAAASVARCGLLHTWRATLRQVRSWPADVTTTHVRIRRSDAAGISDARWVADGNVRLGDIAMTIAVE